MLGQSEPGAADVHFEHPSGVFSIATIQSIEQEPMLDECERNDLGVEAEVGAPIRFSNVPEALE